MFCHSCGNEVPEKAKFCPNCGTMIISSGKEEKVDKISKNKQRVDMKNNKKRYIVVACLLLVVFVVVSNLNESMVSRWFNGDNDYEKDYSDKYKGDKKSDDYDGVYSVDDKHFVIDGAYFGDDEDEKDDDKDYNYGSLNNDSGMHCSSCSGSGTCRKCGGSGRDTVYVAGGTTTTSSCNYCYGSGRCRSCGGDGKQ